MEASVLILVRHWWMRVIYTAHPFVFPASAELVLVVEERQLLDDVVHDQICVDLRLVGHVLLVGLTQLANLIDIEPLIRVDLQHPNNQRA